MNRPVSTFSVDESMAHQLLAADDKILFYGSANAYGEFSNFHIARIVIDGLTYQTTEHYFQAMKFFGSDSDYFKTVRQAQGPKKAKSLGASRQHPIRADWDSARDDVMYRAVHAKFSQHPELRAILVGTGKAYIAEHTARDRYWGDGGDGTGRNQLGKTLMRVRAELMQEEEPHSNPQVSIKTSSSPVASVHTTVLLEEPSDARIIMKEGNVLDATEQFIVHQCNCESTYAKGLAQHLFDRFPFADVYRKRKSTKAVDTPGTIQTFMPRPGERGVINLFGQIRPGPPKGSADDRKAREKYFTEALSLVKEIPGLRSLAFPYSIGCGLAGGDWDRYMAILEGFAAEVAPVRVAVYRYEDAPVPVKRTSSQASEDSDQMRAMKQGTIPRL